MTTSQLAKRPLPPTRLVVVQPEGIAVYAGRERIAFSREAFDYTPAEIEAARIDDYTKEPA